MVSDDQTPLFRFILTERHSAFPPSASRSKSPVANGRAGSRGREKGKQKELEDDFLKEAYRIVSASHTSPPEKARLHDLDYLSLLPHAREGIRSDSRSMLT